MNEDGGPRRIPFRAMIPNAITVLALCMGLTGVRFGIGGEWEKALAAIVLAGILDGMDADSTLISIDNDPQSLEIARNYLSEDRRLNLIHGDAGTDSYQP